MRSTLPLVVKSSVQGDAPARREPFDRAKLRHGIALACAKRPIPPATIDRLVDDIEARLEAMNAEAVPSHAIGEMVIDALRELDGIAYIRYAIVFLGLDDLAALRREIDRLLYERSARGGPPVRG
jgi:transcriptional repressor NrdR